MKETFELFEYTQDDKMYTYYFLLDSDQMSPDKYTTTKLK